MKKIQNFSELYKTITYKTDNNLLDICEINIIKEEIERQRSIYLTILKDIDNLMEKLHYYKHKVDSKKKNNSKFIFITENNWIMLLKGFIKVGSKLDENKLKKLLDKKTNVVFTILEDNESAIELGQIVKNKNMNWIWLSVKKDLQISEDLIPKIIIIFRELKNRLLQKQKIFIHCNDGIYRSGLITHAFLSYLGFNNNEIENVLNHIIYQNIENVKVNIRQFTYKYFDSDME